MTEDNSSRRYPLISKPLNARLQEMQNSIEEVCNKLERLGSALDTHEHEQTFAISHVMSIPAEDCTKGTSVSDFRFTTAHSELVSLAEIAVDVTRSNPIAQVVLEGKDYAKFHYLLVHAAVMQKAKFVYDKLQSFDQGHESIEWAIRMNVLLSLAEKVTPTVSAIKLSECTFKFPDILQTLYYAVDYPLHEFDDYSGPVKIKVRFL